MNNNELRPFDLAIERLTHIITYLGVELEKAKEELDEVKIARIKRVRKLEGESNDE